jgi:hypothetical protein
MDRNTDRQGQGHRWPGAGHKGTEKGPQTDTDRDTDRDTDTDKENFNGQLANK